MDIEMILELIFGWKYIGWALLSLYFFISEMFYWIMCKYDLGKDVDGESMPWIIKKMASFTFGFIAMMILIFLIPAIIVLVIKVIDNPWGSLKIVGALLAVIGVVVLFFYSNYKLWKRYN